jgi:hypothetical protein
MHNLQLLLKGSVPTKRNDFFIVSFGILLLLVFLAIVVTSHPYGRLYFGLITISGAVGGILSATRVRPNNSRGITLDWYHDILYGITGAYLAFWIMPASSFSIPLLQDQNSELLEMKVLTHVIGLSIIGGYAGRALCDKVSGDLLAKYKDLEVKVVNTENEIWNRLEIDNVVSEILDLSDKSEQKVDDLITLLRTSSSQMRRHVYYRAKNLRFEDSIELIHIYKVFRQGINQGPSLMQQRRGYLSIIQEKLDAYYKIFGCLVKSAPSDRKKEIAIYSEECAYSRKDFLIAGLFKENFRRDQAYDESWRRDWGEVCHLLLYASAMDPENHWIKKNLVICEIMQDEDFFFQRQKSCNQSLIKKICEELLRVKEDMQEDGDLLDLIFPIDVWGALNEIHTLYPALIEDSISIDWWISPNKEHRA